MQFFIFSDDHPKWLQLLGTGGTDSSNEKQQVENSQMAFFRDPLSSFLISSWGKLFVLLSYIVYVGLAIYGMLNMDEFFIIERLFRTDSYMYKFNLIEDKFFPEYPIRLEMIIPQHLDYSNLTIQSEIANTITRITDLQFMTSEFSENWLEQFTDWAAAYKESKSIDISTEQKFIDTLRNDFLKPDSETNLDIVFNSDYSQIIASRFILQIKGLKEKVQDMAQVVTDARNIASNQTNFQVYINTYLNRYIDEAIMIRPLSVKLMVIACIVVLAVLLIFIPNLVVASSVFFAIISTQIGVVGFMSLWGVSLDPMSLVSMVMCIGFSVDFAAHISYAFVSSKEEDVNDILRSSLHAVGLPIVQGALSTIICAIPLSWIPSYTFLLCFKVIFLVMTFSTLHALIILPVILIFVKGGFNKSKEVYYVTKF